MHHTSESEAQWREGLWVYWALLLRYSCWRHTAYVWGPISAVTECSERCQTLAGRHFHGNTRAHCNVTAYSHVIIVSVCCCTNNTWSRFGLAILRAYVCCPPVECFSYTWWCYHAAIKLISSTRAPITSNFHQPRPIDYTSSVELSPS